MPRRRQVLRWPSAVGDLRRVAAATGRCAHRHGAGDSLGGSGRGRARRMYQRYRAIQEPMTVELADEGYDSVPWAAKRSCFGG
jgi:hypothetical protein